MKINIKYILISIFLILPIFIFFMLFVSFNSNYNKDKSIQDDEKIKEIIIDDPFFEF